MVSGVLRLQVLANVGSVTPEGVVVVMHPEFMQRTKTGSIRLLPSVNFVTLIPAMMFAVASEDEVD